jgi:Domain of unknown function (DUF4331)
LIANYLPTRSLWRPNYFELDRKGIYQIKIDNDGNGVEDITFQFRFTNGQQNLTINIGASMLRYPCSRQVKLAAAAMRKISAP